MSAAAEHFPQHGRLAGIDFGTVRIGLALSDPGQQFASPLTTYHRRTPAEDERFFRDLAEREQLVGLVVGLPVHASGDESDKSRAARRFADWLAAATGLPIRMFDERFSTVEADHLLSGGKLTAAQRKARRDMLAAQILLAAYLEADEATRSRPPEALE